MCVILSQKVSVSFLFSHGKPICEGNQAKECRWVIAKPSSLFRGEKKA